MTQVEVLSLPASPYIFKKSRGNGLGDRPMATSPTFRLSARRWSLDDLSSELLALIFEQVLLHLLKTRYICRLSLTLMFS